jgi:M6 family metalloprotease-like protein
MKSLFNFILFSSLFCSPVIFSQDKVVSEIKGNISVICFDNFSGHQSYEKYYLNNSQGLFLLKEYNNLKMDINKGDHVVITNGLLSDQTILVDKNNIYKESASISSTNEVKEINMLMILVTYLNGAAVGVPTADEFSAKLLNNNSGIGNYLSEVSAGKAKFIKVDVVGWINVNRKFSRATDSTSMSPDLTLDEFNNIVNNYSIVKTKYDYLAVIENYWNKEDGGGLGYASVGPYYDFRFGKTMRNCAVQIYYSNDPTISMFNQEVTDVKSPESWAHFSRPFMHEMGHTFGFGHANTLNNNDITQVNWYGDYSDLMGGLSGHYSGNFKEIAGWLDSTNTLTISKSGDYTIKNFENNNGTRFAKIQLEKNGKPLYLYLEYRNGTGFDNNPGFNQLHPYNTEGLFLKTTAGFFGDDPDITQLYMIDVNSNVGSGNVTETLNGANIYNNTTWNIQVGPIINRTDSTISFSVKFAQPSNVNNSDIPYFYLLEQNFPNPFNPNTVISYSLPSASNVKLILYNSLGQTIKTLENGFKTEGNYSIDFNASNLPSGVYFYRIQAGSFVQTKKMMLLK